MPGFNNKATAQMLIRLHGLQAQAIAQEHVAEMRQQGDTEALDRWQQVYAAICELRHAAAHARPAGTQH